MNTDEKTRIKPPPLYPLLLGGEDKKQKKYNFIAPYI
jgi:hypothetical protein